MSSTPISESIGQSLNYIIDALESRIGFAEWRISHRQKLVVYKQGLKELGL